MLYIRKAKHTIIRRTKHTIRIFILSNHSTTLTTALRHYFFKLFNRARAYSITISFLERLFKKSTVFHSVRIAKSSQNWQSIFLQIKKLHVLGAKHNQSRYIAIHNSSISTTSLIFPIERITLLDSLFCPNNI